MGQALITRRGVPMLAPDVDDGYEQLINYTMLYDSGDECEEVTGGWNSTGSGSITKNANNIVCNEGTSSSNSTAAIATGYIISKEDNYNRYYVNISQYSDTGTAGDANLRIEDSGAKDRQTLNFTGNGLRCLSINPNASYTYRAVVLSYLSKVTFNFAFLTKPDDINTICYKAGVTIPSSLESLLADTTSLATIFNNEDAVKFMVAQCTGDFMVGVLNNAAAVELLKDSLYLNLVVANPHWAKFAMMIPNAKSIFGFTMLYDEGDECTDVTGGWSSAGKQQNNSYTMSLTKNTNNMYLSWSGNYWRYKYVYTTNNIDFSNFVGIAMKGKSANSDRYPHVSVGIWDATTWADNYPAWTISSVVKNINGLLICDLSDIDPVTSHAVFGFGRGDSQNGSGNMYVYHMFMYKSDDWQTWMSLGGVTGFFDMATLLANSTAMAKLMSNEEAVKYLMGCTGDLMVSILNSSVAVGAIVNSAYAAVMLTSHPAWAKFIKMSPVCADVGLDLLV